MKRNDPEHDRLPTYYSRREMLQGFANGFGMLGLAGLLADEAKADAAHADEEFGHSVGG